MAEDKITFDFLAHLFSDEFEATLLDTDVTAFSSLPASPAPGLGANSSPRNNGKDQRKDREQLRNTVEDMHRTAHTAIKSYLKQRKIQVKYGKTNTVEMYLEGKTYTITLFLLDNA